MNYQKKKTICLCQKELQTNKPHILMPDGSKHTLYCKVPKEIFPHCLRCNSDRKDKNGQTHSIYLCKNCYQFLYRRKYFSIPIICSCQKELQSDKPYILMPDGSKHALYCKVPKEIFPHCLRCGSDLINNKGRSYGRWLCCKCNQYIIYHSNELVKKKKNEYNKMYYKQRLIKEKKREYDELKLMCFTDEEIIEIIELRKEFGKLTTETLMRSYSDIEMDIGEIFTESVIGYILKEREFKK